MRIITISREFGSGGRELGKRLADVLGYDYYDRNIITSVAETAHLDADYVDSALDEQSWVEMPYTFQRSFSATSVLQPPQVSLLQAQREVIEGVMRAGRNCIIVGRNADVFLEQQRPFKVFVCADMEARVERCMERAAEDEQLTRKQVERNIRKIDKNRARTREIIAPGKWGERSQYNLTVNTTDWDIKSLAPVVADFAQEWFREQGL